ncbi:MAG: hypothetical protein ABFD91_16600 [Anaerohalosphaeraceae bacterium]
MSPKEELFNNDSEKSAGSSQPFGSRVTIQPSEQDLFVGDFSFIKDLTAHNPGKKNPGAAATKTGFNPLYAILGVNILIMVILAGMAWFRPAVVIGPQKVQAGQRAEVQNPVPDAPSTQQTVSMPSPTADPAQLVLEKAALTQQEQQQLQEGVSLKTADDFYANKQYLKACYAYQQIAANLLTSQLDNEYLSDYLKLRMAVCLHRGDVTESKDQYFSAAMQSRSAMVRGLASYYLATIQYQNGDYLSARKYAYQAAALLKAFDEVLPASLEGDLYFLAAESLSRHVMGLHSQDTEMPGHLWADTLGDIWPVEMDQAALCGLLIGSGRKISEGAGGPRIEMDTNRAIGSQWSLTCLQSPLEEVLIKIAAKSGTGLTWKTIDTAIRVRPVTAYMLFVPQQYAAEVITGAVGLMWKYDGQNAMILDPEKYDDFDTHRKDLLAEAISIWQRFMLRYRGDHRTPNAHYALGQMYNMDRQYAAGLGEFKLIQSHFAHNPLAPYAYLEASKIKAEMKDFDGARIDLNEMLLQYPECKVVDQATLYLAQATMESGQVSLAADLFKKVFQMDMNEQNKLDAAFGLGRCAYEQKDWATAKEWLGRTLQMLTDENDSRIMPACSMLGRACIELGEYRQASQSLRIALGTKLPDRDYVQIFRELAEAEMCQSNYLEALQILESVPQARLNQVDSCEILITRSKVLRSINATEAAISLLRRKIEFIADSQLRAWLTLELSESYFMQGDYTVARRELNDVMADIQDPQRAQQAGILLARIAEQMNQPRQAEDICRTMLSNPALDEARRKEAFEILGRIYTTRKEFDKAALAFAGLSPQEDGK